MNVIYIGTGMAVLLWTFFNLHHRQRRRNRIVRVDENNCSGCGRCVKRCSHHVLEMVEDETGLHAAVKYPDRCTACGDCLDKCKFNALNLVKRL